MYSFEEQSTVLSQKQEMVKVMKTVKVDDEMRRPLLLDEEEEEK